MHPYHFHHMGRWHRGPSRILWFVLGAATATWWIKRQHGEQRMFGNCRRLAIPPNPETPAPSWPQSVSDIPRAINNIPPAHAVNDTSHFSVSVKGSMGDQWEKRHEYQWDQEKEHLAKISRQATDAMAELTEATLESVLSTAEALKLKLAEHRAQREKQQKQIEKELEEQRKNPPRLV